MSVSDHQLKSLGRIAVNFQFVETVIVFYVCELIGPDQTVGQIVATQLPFGRLCAVAKALFDHRYRDQRLRDQFSELITQAGDLEEKRNQYFHSTWGTDDEQGDVVRVKAKLHRKAGLVRSMPSIPDSELDAVNTQLRACGTSLLKLGGEIGLLRGSPG